MSIWAVLITCYLVMIITCTIGSIAEARNIYSMLATPKEYREHFKLNKFGGIALWILCFPIMWFYYLIRLIYFIFTYKKEDR